MRQQPNKEEVGELKWHIELNRRRAGPGPIDHQQAGRDEMPGARERWRRRWTYWCMHGAGREAFKMDSHSRQRHRRRPRAVNALQEHLPSRTHVAAAWHGMAWDVCLCFGRRVVVSSSLSLSLRSAST
jgi:hypothetical protein